MSYTFTYQKSSLNNLRVLVVDDNNDSLELIKIILEIHSVLVKVTNSVREALLLLAQWNPDVLISDIVMPNDDGYSLIRQIRISKDKWIQQLPAIAITACVTEEGRKLAFESGFSVFAEKPFDPDALIAIIAHLTGVK
ncbi:response regulator [Scytonema sp. NUACC26]|uniref:response regulator n=1 Tax=Scytonema sp. NUACC26 TaxID=3140176 RepID=UPI0034DC78D3